VSKVIKAAIVSLGTEITSGIIKDTHGSFLGAELTAMGIQVERSCQLRDEPSVIPIVKELLRNHDLLLITGGLGPTSDDITREAVADAAGVQLGFDEVLWQELKKKFGLSRAKANRKQAMIPEGFQILANPNGTAPGIWGRVDDGFVCAMPGPPNEMEPMFRQQVRGIIARQFELEVPRETEASSFLIPEARLEDVCKASMIESVLWRTRFQPYKISLYLMGGSVDEQQMFLQRLQKEFGSQLLRAGDTSAAELAIEALKDRGMRLASAESCTGGLVGKLLTDIPGASEVYWGGWVSYSNQAKIEELGVKPQDLQEHGAVSEETVCQMARGALRRSGGDVAVAITGTAGPEGGSPEKPVGTVWIAVETKSGRSQAHEFHFGSKRDLVRRRSAVAALLMAEQAIRSPERLDTVAKWHYS